jgi:hypothetical protein
VGDRARRGMAVLICIHAYHTLVLPSGVVLSKYLFFLHLFWHAKVLITRVRTQLADWVFGSYSIDMRLWVFLIV